MRYLYDKSLEPLMILRPLIAALALAASAAPALADTSITFAPEAQKKLAEDYGMREQAYLERLLTARVERALAAQGVQGSVRLTVFDVTPSRPTLKQMSDKPGLSFQSFGIGGADIEGVVQTSAGEVRLRQDWYETDIVDSQFESTWGDAATAFDRFARRLAKTAAAGG
jgi:hypothetical protein